jgi:hypothetical protein
MDLVIFRFFVSNAKLGPATSPLWKTVVKFYIISIANMVYCFLVIRFNVGSPLTFLLGLGVFLPALVIGLILAALMSGKLSGASIDNDLKPKSLSKPDLNNSLSGQNPSDLAGVEEAEPTSAFGRADQGSDLDRSSSR